MIEEDDEKFDPLLDDVDMATLTEEDVDSESGSQNGLRGVDVQDPSLRIKELWRHGRNPRGSAKQRIFAPRTNCFYNNCLPVDIFPYRIS